MKVWWDCPKDGDCTNPATPGSHEEQSEMRACVKEQRRLVKLVSQFDGRPKPGIKEP